MNYKSFNLGDWIGHISGVIEDETTLDGNEMRDLVEFLSELPQWIPVSEDLPKLYEEVIVTDIETSDTYISRYIGNGYWECDNGLYQNRIIAWQQKLKPYKAESEE